MRTRGWWLALSGPLLAGLVWNLAYTLLIPLVPVLQARFAMPAWEIGLAFGLFPIAGAVAQPLGGLLTDRLGARRVATAGLVLVAVSLLALGSAATGWQVLLWRGVWGAAEGVTITAIYELVYRAATRARRDRGSVMGWFGGMARAGMALGVLGTGVAYSLLGFSGMFRLGAGCALLSGILIWALTGDLADAPSPDAEQRDEPAPAPDAAPAMRSLAGLVALIGLLDAAGNALYSALEPLLPLRLTALSAHPVRDAGVLFCAGLVTCALASALLGPVVRRLGTARTLGAAFALFALGICALSAARSIAAAGAIFLVLSVADPAAYIATRRALAEVPEAARGRAIGIFGLISDGGYALGPILGGALWPALGSGVFVVLALPAALVALGCTARRGGRGSRRHAVAPAHAMPAAGSAELAISAPLAD